MGAGNTYLRLTKMGVNDTYLGMTHTDLILRWPSIAEFGRDIGVPYEAAKAMRRRGNIPAQYWKRAGEAARLRGIDGVEDERVAELVSVASDLPRRQPEAAP
ncbi:MAG: hypothetical protein ABGW90_11705 [Martelella sp.]